MVLQNHNTIAARSNYIFNVSTFSNNNTNNNDVCNSTSSITSTTTNNNNRMNGQQRPVIDLLVAMIAVPILILCALQLEKNLHDMTHSPESRWLVFALGIGMLTVSVIICGYVTHRMGVCLWAGPIEDVHNRSADGQSVTHINSQSDILRIVDSLPPSYDSVVKFDIPPPPYNALVIEMEQGNKQQQQSTSGNKDIPENHTVHI